MATYVVELPAYNPDNVPDYDNGNTDNGNGDHNSETLSIDTGSMSYLSLLLFSFVLLGRRRTSKRL